MTDVVLTPRSCQTAVVGRKARRLGLGGKLFLAFGAVAATTVVASLVGWLSFIHVDRALTGIVDGSMPTTLLAQQLAEESVAATAGGPVLAAASTHEERKAAFAPLIERRDALRRLLDTMAVRQVAGTESDIQFLGYLARVMARTLDEQNEVVARRIDQRDRREAALADMAALHMSFTEAIGRLRDPAAAGTEKASAMADREKASGVGGLQGVLELAGTGNLVAGLLTEAASVPVPERLAPLRDRFLVAAQDMRRLLVVLADDRRLAAARETAGALLRYGEADGIDLIQLRQAELTAAAGVATLLENNRKLAGWMVDTVRGLVTVTKAGIERDAAEARLALRHASLLLAALSVASLLVAALVAWRYVGRNILARLTELAATTRRIAGGDVHAVIRRSGDDEITDMSDALVIFREAAGQLAQRTEALRASEARFRELIEGSIQGILIHRDFKPLFANDALARIYGFASATEMVAQPSILPLIPSHDHEAAIRKYRRMLVGETSAGTRRTVNLRRDGSSLWVDLTARVVDWMGQPAVQIVVVDVTRHMEAEAELAAKTHQLEAAFAAMPSGILFMDRNQDIVLRNDLYLQIWEYPAEIAAPGHNFAELLRFDIARGQYLDVRPDEEIGRILHLLRTEGELGGERRLADGRTVLIQGRREPDGGVVLTYTDITGQKQVESELRAAKESAEKALTDLKDAQEQLIQSEKLASLGGLVAGVAHEINTPVGSSLTAVSFLGQKTREMAALFQAGTVRKSDLAGYLATVAEAAQLMQINLERAAEMVQTFKQIAIDQTCNERRDFFLDEYMHEVLLSLKPQIRKTPHRVEMDCPAGIVMDGFPGPLYQVLANLVMNALIHAFDEVNGDGQVRLVARLLGSDGVEITVTDDGKGMDDTVRRRAFDPFFTTRRGRGGSGLGLHIVYNLVTQAMGGQLDLETTVGRGTTFRLRLPRVAPG